MQLCWKIISIRRFQLAQWKRKLVLHRNAWYLRNAFVSSIWIRNISLSLSSISFGNVAQSVRKICSIVKMKDKIQLARIESRTKQIYYASLRSSESYLRIRSLSSIAVNVRRMCRENSGEKNIRKHAEKVGTGKCSAQLSFKRHV